MVIFKKNLLVPGKEFRKKRRREKISQKISELSFGALNKTCDLVLTFVTMLADPPRTSRGLTLHLTSEYYQSSVDIKRWIEGFYKIRRKHWVDGSGVLTKEGKERLDSLFPRPYFDKHWDKTWHLVNFDIPETRHAQRNVLRDKLKKLGFGMMQQSIWISPMNLLGTVQKEVEALELAPYVLCAQSQNLGEEESRVLANRIWRLDRVNEEYEEFIRKYEKGVEQGKFFSVFLEFASILQRDPGLPQELLPNKWKGRDAYDLLREFYMKAGIKNPHLVSFFGDKSF